MLRDAVESARGIGNIHVWGDGVPVPPDLADVTPHALPSLPATSVLNLMIQSSWDDDVMFWLHNDGLILPGVAPKFMQHVHDLPAEKRWGVVFTHYDVLCAFNMRAVREVGYWDTMFFQYTADVDYYRRLLIANWPILQFGDGNDDSVLHRRPDGSGGGGSNTIQADALYNYRVQWRSRTGFDRSYFMCKWGLPDRDWKEINRGVKIPFATSQGLRRRR